MNTKAGPYTVDDACQDYLKFFVVKGANPNTRRGASLKSTSVRRSD
jgi:hypothetical protein